MTLGGGGIFDRQNGEISTGISTAILRNFRLFHCRPVRSDEALGHSLASNTELAPASQTWSDPVRLENPLFYYEAAMWKDLLTSGAARNPESPYSARAG